MDATAAGAAAPGPSGSAPRLRVDELLDDVANSVRRERIEMAPASPSARIAFFFSVVSGAQAFSPCSLFLSLSLFDFSCLVDGDVTFLSASQRTEKER